MAKGLIVNADDFGLTPGVNSAIVDAHRRGIVTSATLMANGSAFESAVRFAGENPTLGVGVHLNLIEGPPVATSDSVPTLVDGSGKMNATPAALARALLRRAVSLDDVERELRAQISKVVDAGVAPTHLDGHKHAHLFPPVFDVVVRLAREFGIAAVRCATEPRPALRARVRANGGASGKIAKQFVMARALSAFAVADRAKLERAGLTSPRRLLGVTETGYLNTETVRAMIAGLPDGVTELMCHPGYADDELRATRTRLVESREVELEALTDPEVRALLGREGIRLINYREMAEYDEK